MLVSPLGKGSNKGEKYGLLPYPGGGGGGGVAESSEKAIPFFGGLKKDQKWQNLEEEDSQADFLKDSRLLQFVNTSPV